MVIIFFIIHIISILHLASLKFQNVLKRVPSRRNGWTYKGCNRNCGNRRTYNTMANIIRPHNVRQNTTQKTKRLSNTNPTRMNSGTPEMKAFPAQLVAPFVYSCKKPIQWLIRKKDQLVTTTNVTYPWSSATQIVSYNLTSLNGHRKTSEHTNQA